MLRNNINSGLKKEIPLFARNDMVLGFIGVVAVPRGLVAQRPPYFYLHKRSFRMKRSEMRNLKLIQIKICLRNISK